MVGCAPDAPFPRARRPAVERLLLIEDSESIDMEIFEGLADAIVRNGICDRHVAFARKVLKEYPTTDVLLFAIITGFVPEP